METLTRRGRPPVSKQHLPRFLGAARGRVKRNILMSARTATELRNYVVWAGRVMMAPKDEIMVRVVDYALAEHFRRDKSWQIARTGFVERSRKPVPASGNSGASVTP